MANHELGERSLDLEGCECCNGEYFCCPEPCCGGNPRIIDWGEKCGSIEWKEDFLPPKVDIYLAVYEGKPYVKVVRSPDQPSR